MSSSPTVKSARRVLEVLEYFAEHHHPATVTEISTQLGYPQSSASVLLASLVEQGYLMCDRAQRTYRPTLRVMLLGAWMHDELFGEGSLVSELDKLRRRTRCTVMIGVRQQIHSRFMLVLWGPKRWAPRYSAGSLVPVPRSAMGRVLLAGESIEEISRVVRRANAELQDAAERFPLAGFLRDIELFRQRGWAETIDYPKPGLAALAVALPPLAGHPPMALALGTAKAELVERRQELVGALQDAVARIERSHSPASPA
jgi:DNA-binding IclR family transcriptional regulator